MKRKQLYFGISKSLSKREAIDFKKSLGTDERYFLLKVSENPNSPHVDRRERYVVVRFPRKGESVTNGYAVFANRDGLI